MRFDGVPIGTLSPAFLKPIPLSDSRHPPAVGVKYPTMNFPTLEDFVGNTPLVRLQRLLRESSNTILVKLEGNNPAGSVKDRPALSMIKRAETRGETVWTKGLGTGART